MALWARLTARVRRLRGFDDDDLQAEIQAHLDIAAADRAADGADRTRARQDAIKDFGNVTLTREAARRVWTPHWLEILRDYAGDVRYAVNALARTPAFSLTVVAVLTLGIGLNAAAFTMLKSMAVNPLSGVARSSKIAVMFGETSTGRELRVSYPDYQYLRGHDTSFVELFGSSLITAGLGRGRGARSIWTELVTGNYFRVLGVTAQRGRLLGPDDDAVPARQPVVVISDALWRRSFEADPAIVGKSIEISHQMLTVVGVVNPDFHGTIVGYDVEAFAPITMAAPLGVTGGSALADPLSDRDAGMIFPHGFLRPGVTPAMAAAEADAAWMSLSAARPADGTARHLRVVTFPESPTGAQTFLLASLILLTAMGLLVLLIACANIAGLVLVRGVSRRGEIAVRLALGASRARIVRMLVIENLVLALPGAVLGVLLAQRSIPFLAAYAQEVAQPSRLFFNVGVDSSVIAFSVVVGVASALVFGFVPALQASRVDLVSVITQDASPRGSARGRFRSSLVVAQVAVSLLLLIGAGLVARTLEAVRTAYPGFDATDVAAIGMDVRQNAYTESDGHAFYHRLLDKVRADPGVESADLAAFSPLALIDTPSKTVSIEGYTPRRDEDLAFMFNAIAGDYFRTLRIPIEAGRAFNDHDDETGGRVVIVNDTLARRFWGGAEQAIGRRITTGDGAWRTVVGVAQDIKYLKINESPRPYFYLPFFQSYRTSVELNTRGTSAPDALAARARDQVASLDADLPVLYAKPLTERIAGTRIIFKLTAMMLLIFGTTGLILAGLGTYGLVSYTVRQSTHEIGIRLALGASAFSVVRGFLSRGLRLGAIGAAIGIVVALAAGRLIESALFGVSATDPGSFTRALAIVLGGVLLATVVPAWRASRTDPLRALRRS